MMSLFNRGPEDDGGLNIIVAYVDEILIAGKDDTELLRAATDIEKHVEFHKEHIATKFLGIRIDYTELEGTLKICSSLLNESTLHRFGMTEDNAFLTSIASGTMI